MSSTAWRVAKEEAVGDHGMVAASHPLAVQAGLEVLRRGGNAVDAAVTMAFAMGVVEPHGSGIGGGGLMIVHQARAGRTAVVDFAMDAPLSATPAVYQLEDTAGGGMFGWRKVKDDANIVGYRAASVPGLVRGLSTALERFGTIPLRQALEPAIGFAEDGFDVNWYLALEIAMSMPILSRFPAAASVFLPHGFPLRPPAGSTPADRLVQKDLARTLRLIAGEGPDAFYHGPVARAIADAMRQHGGLISEEDLARYQATIHDGGLAIDYRGYRVVGVPGASGGISALQSLRILEGFDLSAYAPDSPERAHRLAETFRHAFADRFRYVADPKQEAVPWSGLLSEGYAGAVRSTIDPVRAAERVEPGDPWPFQNAAEGAERFSGGGTAAPHRQDRPGDSRHGAGSGGQTTTHICAVDSERNMVTLTQTVVDYFGSGAMVPGTGVLLNNAMQWFDPEPGRPNSIAPGKRGVNNMTPLLVLRDGQPFLAVGAPGGRRIINAMSQVVANVIDHGLGIQDAIATPRIDCSGPQVLVDSRFPEAVPRSLKTLGHRVQVVEEIFHRHNFSRPLGILVHPETGRLHGGADPFRLAIAAGW